MMDYESIGDYMSSDRSYAGVALTFLFIGLGTGALLALFLAPKSGRDMRRLVRRKYADAKDALEDLGEQAEDVIERGSEWASAAKEKVAPLSKALRRS